LSSGWVMLLLQVVVLTRQRDESRGEPQLGLHEHWCSSGSLRRCHWTGVSVVVFCINDKNRQNEQPGLADEQTWSLEFPSNPAFTMTPMTSPAIQNQTCPVVGRTVSAPHNRRGCQALLVMRKSLYFNHLTPKPSVARPLV
jgi:hypothetical protein